MPIIIEITDKPNDKVTLTTSDGVTTVYVPTGSEVPPAPEKITIPLNTAIELVPRS